jgi:hypothetical protein
MAKENNFGLSRRFFEVAAVKGNRPPFIKINRAVRYCVTDLRDWIEALALGRK